VSIKVQPGIYEKRLVLKVQPGLGINRERMWY
jgi:hypothetical protein